MAEGLSQVNRENGKRRITVQANVSGRDLGSFVEEARRKIEAEVTLEPGTWLDWGGQYQNLMAARERLALVVPLCFFMIFLFLFSTFNSVKYALIVFQRRAAGPDRRHRLALAARDSRFRSRPPSALSPSPAWRCSTAW